MMFCHPSQNTWIVQKPLGYVAFPEYHQSGCQKDAPLPLNERCRNVFYSQNYVSTTNTMICEGYKYRNCNHNSTGNQPSKHVWRNHPRIPCCRTTALNPHPLHPCVSVDGEKHCDCDYAPAAAATCLGIMGISGSQPPMTTGLLKDFMVFWRPKGWGKGCIGGLGASKFQCLVFWIEVFWSCLFPLPGCQLSKYQKWRFRNIILLDLLLGF